MAINNYPGVGPQNTDIATAVAAAVPTNSSIAAAVPTNSSIATAVAAAVPTNTSIAAAVGTSFNPTNMTLQQTITSSSNNISTGRNFVYALVIGGGAGGIGSTANLGSGYAGSGGGAAFGLTPSSSVAVVGAGGTGGFPAGANTHNSTGGGASSYGWIRANGATSTGRSWASFTNMTYNSSGYNTPGFPGSAGFDSGSYLTFNTTGLTRAATLGLDGTTVTGMGHQYALPKFGGEYASDSTSLGGNNAPAGDLMSRGFVTASGSPGMGAGNSNAAFSGRNTVNYSGGAGGTVVNFNVGSAGGGGGAGYLGAGNAGGNGTNSNTAVGNGGNGGSGGGGGGGALYNNGAVNLASTGGNGGSGAILLWY